MNAIIDAILKESNTPLDGEAIFNSSDHIRFQNGQDVSGHNYACHRAVKIEKNIDGEEGYTVTIFNIDGIHPVWQNNVQMSPKQMRIIGKRNNVVELHGYGYDPLGASFADYGILLLFEDNEIQRVQLNMYDRNISIVYLK